MAGRDIEPDGDGAGPADDTMDLELHGRAREDDISTTFMHPVPEEMFVCLRDGSGYQIWNHELCEAIMAIIDDYLEHTESSREPGIIFCDRTGERWDILLD